MATQVKSVQCPWCRRPLPVGAVVCMGCGYNRRTGAMVTKVEVVEEPPPPPVLTRKQRWQQTGLDSFWDWEIPIGMIVASALYILFAHLITAEWTTLPRLVFYGSVAIAAQAGWMYAGISMLEFVAKADFGDWRDVMLKMLAISAFWTALGVACEWSAPGYGSKVQAAVGWPIQFFLLRWLLGIDSLWAVGVLLMTIAVQWIVGMVLPV